MLFIKLTYFIIVAPPQYNRSLSAARNTSERVKSFSRATEIKIQHFCTKVYSFRVHAYTYNNLIKSFDCARGGGGVARDVYIYAMLRDDGTFVMYRNF